MRRIASSLALVGVVALGGCGGEASPKPAPLSASLTSTPTPSPSPDAAPTRPPESLGLSEAAARETVKFYFVALAHARNTGDVSSLRSMGASACKSCAGNIRVIRYVYDGGGSFSGTEFTVVEFSKSIKVSNGYRFELKLRSAEEKFALTATETPTDIPSRTGAAQFRVTPQAGRYVVAEWDA